MRVRPARSLALVILLIAAACGDDDGAATTTTAATTTRPPVVTTTMAAPTTTSAPIATTTSTTGATTTTVADGVLRVEAPAAAIVVDGRADDWEGVAGLDLMLEPIATEEVEPRPMNVRVAHDDEFVYVLFTIDDDYDYDPDDRHQSAAMAVMWAVEVAAGPHMGTDSLGEEPTYTSLGLVDVWHWELDCGPEVDQGGDSSGGYEAGFGGNDAKCNLDDEWASDPKTRDDDGGAGADNHLLGVFTHTDPTDDAPGTWVWELRRPLASDDGQDAQFTIGGVSLMALAYWDPDVDPDGWDDPHHVQSAGQGWIEVTLLAD